ncbi:hypothetical protein DPMN_105465 [Dreissena polymorpha]|uniref:Uncharacterized protein n=1 Tax=Dreissena polymorpha TaxID=45954 RepID=A0A9D4HGU3_DREPO|nr:hypothetical protein DPMN_105465 [Dreissena polymorpha]
MTKQSDNPIPETECQDVHDLPVSLSGVIGENSQVDVLMLHQQPTQPYLQYQHRWVKNKTMEITLKMRVTLGKQGLRYVRKKYRHRS